MVKDYNKEVKDMLTITQYHRASDLEEAYQVLMEKRSNRILGGMLWLRQSRQYVHTAIDLQDLGLNQIIDGKEYLKIGAMVTLHQLETDPLISGWVPSLAESVGHIVGVQFRNLATVGGSVFMKAGFSNLLTALLPLDVEVCLHRQGRLSLEAFLKQPYQKDILTHLFISKNALNPKHLSLHGSASDLPIVAVACATVGTQWRLAVGARPARAHRLVFNRSSLSFDQVETAIRKELVFGDNSRASAAYRRAIALTLVRRLMEEQV